MLSNIFVIVIVCIASLAVQTDSFATHSRTLHRLGKTALRAASGDDKDYELELRSPCKINLFLRIMGRRENGYHDLASLFQTISLSDEMYFSRLPESATKDEMVCTDSELSVDDSNLVIKALNLMRSKTGVNQYFSVKLNKIVPMQAGLGGGSANAATAMFAFNKLCGFPATLGDLKEWSGDIGSDITFFFSTGTAYCTGRGEIIDPLPPLPEGERTLVHIVKPM
jgi:4-diphosphocytidyl-2-C-methyl-D-erythritol kinase